MTELDKLETVPFYDWLILSFTLLLYNVTPVIIILTVKTIQSKKIKIWWTESNQIIKYMQLFKNMRKYTLWNVVL